MRTKRELGVFISKLKIFDKPNWKLEQYPTESDVAAELIWHANLVDDFEDKIVCDLGCGTGILGIGALLAGAKKVYFIDVDKRALELAKENIEYVKSEYEIDSEIEFIQSDIRDVEVKCDVVLQNPPFGVKDAHADRVFLTKAFQTAKVIYTLHKVESKEFIAAISKDEGFETTNFWEFDFPLKQTMDYHTKKIKRIKVGGWRLEKSE